MSFWLLQKEIEKGKELIDKIYIMISSFLEIFYLFIFSQISNKMKLENVRDIIPDGLLMICGGIVML